MSKFCNPSSNDRFINKLLLGIALATALVVCVLIRPVVAQQTANKDGDQIGAHRLISPVRGINHSPDRDRELKRGSGSTTNSRYRSIDGSDNNLENLQIGAAQTQLTRIVPSDYDDGTLSLAGSLRPSARAISNIVVEQHESMPNPLKASDFLWQWGQFLDHDIDLTDGADPAEPANIAVPQGDIYFDPSNSGAEIIAFNRSIYDTSIGVDSPRQQINEITAWIDASNVYGSNEQRAHALRTLAGDGKLKTSEGNLLPFNDTGLANAGGGSSSLFLAGDVRANEQVGLTAMHTLFMREHNRLADLIAENNPRLSSDEIYQQARQLVGAEMQIITYREYLPALLGRGAIPRYQGYKPLVDGSIANSFSAAAYRYGHSALSNSLLRIDEFGEESIYGHLPLRNAFFNPTRIIDEGGIEPLLRGLASQVCQTVDAKVIDDVRNFLFGAPGAGGFDLAALNIQRGRDHGLPSYNDMREHLGFRRANNFSDISSDTDTQGRLAAAYSSVDDVDLWVGGLSEEPLPAAHVGPLFHAIIKDQFQALRDGDRYWYAKTLNAKQLEIVEGLRLSDIIRLNTSIGDEIQRDVFHLDASPEHRSSGAGPNARR